MIFQEHHNQFNAMSEQIETDPRYQSPPRHTLIQYESRPCPDAPVKKCSGCGKVSWSAFRLFKRNMKKMVEEELRFTLQEIYNWPLASANFFVEYCQPGVNSIHEHLSNEWAVLGHSVEAGEYTEDELHDFLSQVYGDGALDNFFHSIYHANERPVPKTYADMIRYINDSTKANAKFV